MGKLLSKLNCGCCKQHAIIDSADLRIDDTTASYYEIKDGTFQRKKSHLLPPKKSDFKDPPNAT